MENTITPRANDLPGRIPPHNIQAEQSVLGAAMIGKRALVEITAILKDEDFYRPDHALIYEALTELALAAKPVDILTVSDLLEGKNQLAEVGGLAYISSLTDKVPIIANAAHYADLVRQKSILRKLIRANDEVTGLCFEDVEKADLLLDLAAKKIYEIRENRPRVEAMKSMSRLAFLA